MVGKASMERATIHGAGPPVAQNGFGFSAEERAIRDVAAEGWKLKERSSNGPRVSVVVPVRNRSEDLVRCLDCLLRQTLPAGEFEILICDDGSDSQDARAIERAVTEHDGRAGQVRYLRQSPRGPAAARNLGIRAARGEIVAFTDSDTLPSAGWLASLLVPFADAEVVAVEGPVRAPEPRVSPLQDAPRSEGGVFLTANMAYRRSVLEAIGGLDEAFPMPAFEDADLALAARGTGKFVHASDALVLHPWRRLTLRASVKRPRQLDWLLVTALRHGCLGWENRPTRYPRVRVSLAATVSLPLGRAKGALRYVTSAPADAFLRVFFCLVEALICLARVPHWLLGDFNIERRRFLEGGSQ